MLIIVSVIDNISTVSDIICCRHVPDPFLPQLWRNLFTYLDLISEFCPSMVGFSRKKLFALFNDIDCMMHHFL